jgi:coproporphyrinogen III oxidase-like Fe-S oxidoreductase
MAETLMLNLRLTEGVEIQSFLQRFGLSPTEAFPNTFQRYLDTGAVEITPTHVRLHRETLFTSNCVLVSLLEESEERNRL